MRRPSESGPGCGRWGSLGVVQCRDGGDSCPNVSLRRVRWRRPDVCLVPNRRSFGCGFVSVAARTQVPAPPPRERGCRRPRQGDRPLPGSDEPSVPFLWPSDACPRRRIGRMAARSANGALPASRLQRCGAVRARHVDCNPAPPWSREGAGRSSMSHPARLIWLFVFGYLAASALSPQSIGCSSAQTAVRTTQVVSR